MKYFCSAPEAGCWALAASLLVEDSQTSEIKIRLVRDDTSRGELGVYLSRKLQRKRHCFSHDQPEEHLGENFQYRLG